MAAGWTTGLAFSALGSVIGAVSKLCLRRSYTCSAPHTSMTKSSSVDVPYCEQNETDPLSPVSHRTDEESTSVASSQCSGEASPFKKVRVPSSLSQHSLAAPVLRGLGMLGMMVLSPACSIYALQFASPSILCPLGSGLMLVWVILLSECTIGEQPRYIQILAAGLIIVGEVLISLSGDHTNAHALGVQQVINQYKEPAFVAYFGALILWVLCMAVIIQCGSQGWKRFAWGVLGGSIMGVQCFVKDALSLVHGLNTEHLSLVLYLLVVFAVAFPMTGFLLLMACMRRYEALYSTSMYVGSMVVSASLMSVAHYHTFDNLETSTRAFYPIGLFVLLGGIFILALETHVNGPNLGVKVVPDVPHHKREYGAIA